MNHLLDATFVAKFETGIKRLEKSQKSLMAFPDYLFNSFKLEVKNPKIKELLIDCVRFILFLAACIQSQPISKVFGKHFEALFTELLLLPEFINLINKSDMDRVLLRFLDFVDEVCPTKG